MHTMEEVALAVGEVLGHGLVKSATRLSCAVVLFIEKVEQTNLLVERGLNVGGKFEDVLLLCRPATKVTLSNIPLFITDNFLCTELSRNGKVVSQITKLPSGCKSHC